MFSFSSSSLYEIFKPRLETHHQPQLKLQPPRIQCSVTRGLQSDINIQYQNPLQSNINIQYQKSLQSYINSQCPRTTIQYLILF